MKLPFFTWLENLLFTPNEQIKEDKPILETMKTVHIHRKTQDHNQTLGNLSVINEEGKPVFGSVVLERGWRNNAKGESCIPVGEYVLKLEYSPRFRMDLWEVYGVPGRSECKFHAANYWYQLNGCMAPGETLVDLNKDGYNDVTNSKNTLKKFMAVMGNDKVAKLVVHG